MRFESLIPITHSARVQQYTNEIQMFEATTTLRTILWKQIWKNMNNKPVLCSCLDPQDFCFYYFGQLVSFVVVQADFVVFSDFCVLCSFFCINR